MIKVEWHGHIWEAYLDESPEVSAFGNSEEEAIDNLKDKLEGNDE